MEKAQIITILVSGLSAFLGAYLTYYFGIKRLRKELVYAVQKDKNTKILEAYQQFWKLLAFTTDTENPKSILIWNQEKGNSEKKYHVRREQAEQFMTALPGTFYDNGYGLYLDKEIRPLFFEYRSILYGLLLANKDNQPEILIHKKELADQMIKIHKTLVALLRQQANLIAPELPS